MESCYHSRAIESLLDVGVGAPEPRNIIFKMREKYTGIDCSADLVRIVGTPYPQALYFSKKMEPINCQALFGTNKLPRIACKATSG